MAFEDKMVFEGASTIENIAFDLSHLQKGYYRIYLKIGQDTLYDNLVFTH